MLTIEDQTSWRKDGYGEKDKKNNQKSTIEKIIALFLDFRYFFFLFGSIVQIAWIFNEIA